MKIDSYQNIMPGTAYRFAIIRKLDFFLLRKSCFIGAGTL